MLATLILWSHALAALLFGVLALWRPRGGVSDVPRGQLAFALGATSLWALAAAGIESSDPAIALSEGVSRLAWLAFMFKAHRPAGDARARAALNIVYGVVAAVAALHVALALIGDDAAPQLAAPVRSAGLLIGMLVAVAALLLAQGLHSDVAKRAGGGLRWLVLAAGGYWLLALNLGTIAYLVGDWTPGLRAARGIGMVLLALAVAVGVQRRTEWRVQVSRTIAYQSLSLIGIGVYFTLLAVATSAIAAVAGDNARLLQAAFVFGSTAAILTLLSSPWLRAWAKVKLAKHFFRHRYDYRAEWLRFTETLGKPESAATLSERMVKAVADLTDSPAGVLLVPDGEGLNAGAVWKWDRASLPAASDAALARHLKQTGRIVELDALRADPDCEEAAAVPQWMLDRADAWVLVPLPHFDRLAGAILLARPPLPRALDWEDFDLLKAVGRQVASYLAEARAQDRLSEVQRFDEFNRRFAFILHDIKNLVSQLSLVARNAERHADNPEFRADMVATLRESSERMNALLARLSQHHRARADAVRPVDVVAVAERVAAARRGGHPVVVSHAGPACALADAAGLEQLLGQLVQNAIEASPAIEPVTLHVGHDGGAVAIDVIDQGCGMSPGFIRDKLFKPFVSSKPDGFGIGAFEALQLATAMEGRIDVTSREGRGSRFRVILKNADAMVGKAA